MNALFSPIWKLEVERTTKCGKPRSSNLRQGVNQSVNRLVTVSADCSGERQNAKRGQHNVVDTCSRPRPPGAARTCAQDQQAQSKCRPDSRCSDASPWLPHVTEIFALLVFPGIFTTLCIPETSRITSDMLCREQEVEPSAAEEDGCQRDRSI